MNPVFSVVIPTYNQADFLRTALRSVLDQTFRDFEVVIVNNYSTDHTLDVVADSKDERVRAINFRNHGVIGAGRNVGIKASNGTYIAFLDSDDTWCREKLERVAEVIQSDPQVGLICHDQEIVRDGKVVRRSHYGLPPGFRGNLYDYLVLVENCVSTSATVVAKRYLDEVGSFSEDLGLVTVEDYDLWVRLSTVCHFRFIRAVLGRHHFHSSSSSANVELHLRSGLAILEKHHRELKESGRPYPKNAIRLRCAKAFFGAARQYHRRGALKKALGYYARTVWAHPFYQMTYAGLVLLFADMLLGQTRRKKVTDAIRPGA
jgi:glycosyltransferase involved in cell wall biosynthesis